MFDDKWLKIITGTPVMFYYDCLITILKTFFKLQHLGECDLDRGWMMNKQI